MDTHVLHMRITNFVPRKRERQETSQHGMEHGEKITENMHHSNYTEKLLVPSKKWYKICYSHVQDMQWV